MWSHLTTLKLQKIVMLPCNLEEWGLLTTVSVPNFTTVSSLNWKSCQATSKSYRFVCDNWGTIQIIKIVPPEPKGIFFMSALYVFGQWVFVPSAIIGLILYNYQDPKFFESFGFANIPSHLTSKDGKKIFTMGPWTMRFETILLNADMTLFCKHNLKVIFNKVLFRMGDQNFIPTLI